MPTDADWIDRLSIVETERLLTDIASIMLDYNLPDDEVLSAVVTEAGSGGTAVSNNASGGLFTSIVQH